MLTQHREKLECLAKALEAEETLDDVAIEKLLGPPAWKTAEAAANNGKALPAELKTEPGTNGKDSPLGQKHGEQNDGNANLPLISTLSMVNNHHRILLAPI